MAHGGAESVGQGGDEQAEEAHGADHGGGGGGEGQDGDARRERCADVGDAEVGGAEVVTPLRDAVALVDGEEADVHGAQLGAEEVGGEALGGEVEELVIAEDAVVKPCVDLGAGHAGVDGGGLDATPAEAIYLVFHQGDERGDDEAEAFGGQCGHLEGERLAAAGGHEREGVAAGADGADDLLLQRPEGVVAPVLLQYFVIAIHRVSILK